MALTASRTEYSSLPDCRDLEAVLSSTRSNTYLKVTNLEALVTYLEPQALSHCQTMVDCRPQTATTSLVSATIPRAVIQSMCKRGSIFAGAQMYLKPQAVTHCQAKVNCSAPTATASLVSAFISVCLFPTMNPATFQKPIARHLGQCPVMERCTKCT